MTLTTRPPTGKVPYPLVLVEGGEKAGKSWSAALLSASDRVGDTYWIDLGEGSADEYGAIPGVRYQVVEHDGSWAQILAAVTDVRDLAEKASRAEAAPVVLVLDSATALWEGLKDWASSRARTQKGNAAKLRADPNAEVSVSMNLWNDAGTRYRRLMTILLTFPGIVVLTARGKEVALMEEGKPVEGKKDYRVEGHKTLAFDCSLWLRLSRDDVPVVVGARSVNHGVRPGRDKPREITNEPDNILDWLIFDVLKVGTGARPRDLKPVTGGDLTQEERAAEAGEEPAAVRPQGQADRSKRTAAETTEWTDNPPRSEPVRVTDRKRLDAWSEQVVLSSNLTEIKVYRAALTAMWTEHALTKDDAAEAGKLLAELEQDIADQAARERAESAEQIAFEQDANTEAQTEGSQ